MHDILFTPFLVPVIAIIGAFTYAIVAALARARVREFEIRERIAMIEKGLVPPPEVDPRGFERAMGMATSVTRLDQGRGAGRHRRAGITLVGIGLGLMLLISVAGGATSEGIGVGGFIAIVGAAFLVNSLFESQAVSRSTAAGNAAAPSDTPASGTPSDSH